VIGFVASSLYFWGNGEIAANFAKKIDGEVSLENNSTGKRLIGYQPFSCGVINLSENKKNIISNKNNRQQQYKCCCCRVEGGELFDRVVASGHLKESTSKLLFYQMVAGIKVRHFQWCW